MKIAILSDIHGNDVYFQKCISEIKKQVPDRIIALGDYLGYMHEGDTIITELRKMDAKLLLGNHEAMMLGDFQYSPEKEDVYGLKTDKERISKDNLKYIENLSSELYEEIDGEKVLYVHGCPNNPLNGYLYEDDTKYHWGQDPYDFVFMGHTHHSYLKKNGAVTYVNVGSCGLPREDGRVPSYAIFDTQIKDVIIYKVLISKRELEEVLRKNIHPSVRECLMRKGNK